MQEDITQGERVRKYILEGKAGKKWIRLAVGSCVGHKRIELLENPPLLSALRLRIVESADTPLIKNLSVYTK